MLGTIVAICIIVGAVLITVGCLIYAYISDKAWSEYQSKRMIEKAQESSDICTIKRQELFKRQQNKKYPHAEP